MSKALDKFGQKAKGLKNAANKFSPSAREGHRIIPSRPSDADFQCRIDAGKYDEKTKKLNVALQVNSQAKSPGLSDWAKKHTTHENLAVGQFDTAATDKKSELNRLIDELTEKGKEKLKGK